MALGKSRVSGGNMIVAAAVVGLMMAVAGCGTMGLQGSDLPRGAKVVGGGFLIDWEAPTAGTVYLVEKTTGKIVETTSLDEDDSYDFEMRLDDESVTETFTKTFGIPVKEAKLVLYFKPAGPKAREQ
jgi:hypothetical protein